MNWCQFKGPLLCLAGTVVAFMTLTQEIASLRKKSFSSVTFRENMWA